ncbi:MAG: hypothetical protein JSR58_07945 [Verrucomicrobia bacterium]|nr:hypothetical protein [Verrucomicrobiota bacterium]
MTQILKFIVCLWLFFQAEHFCQKQTDGFTVLRVQPKQSYPAFDVESPEWSLPPQRFVYLARGAQCYVFASEDGKYVLKLFKKAHLLPSVWSHIPLINRLKPFKPSKMERMRVKQQRDYMGYKVAFERFREDTMLTYLHLNPTEMNLPTVTIVDKIGIEHQIDLNKTSFAVQKRVLSFNEWLAGSTDAEVQKGIQDIAAFFQKRVAAGVSDNDSAPYNFGFFEGRPIQIDPGHYELFTGNPELELVNMKKRFIKWMRKNKPELVTYVQTAIPDR